MSSPRTFVERARRDQITACAVDVIAEHGLAAASVSRIAAAAGISKAAVLYHFSTRDAVLDNVVSVVTSALVTDVGAAVDAADGPAQAVDAYVRGILRYFGANPAHARTLAEVLRVDRGPAGGHETRWSAVAGLLRAAQKAGEMRDFDVRTVALVIGGAVDAVVAEHLEDPEFDLDAAAEVVVDVVHRATSVRTRRR